MVSDTTEVPSFGTKVAKVAVPDGHPGAPVWVHGYGAVDFFLYLANAGSLTGIQIRFQTTAKRAPVNADWATIQAEEISAGVGTEEDYVYQKAVAAPATLVATIPCRGLWIRPVFTALGDATGSLCYATSLRRAS